MPLADDADDGKIGTSHFAQVSLPTNSAPSCGNSMNFRLRRLLKSVTSSLFVSSPAQAFPVLSVPAPFIGPLLLVLSCFSSLALPF